ncbi:MAG: MFS transporter [Myxococcales bacterium]|jgi:MFS family permease|nr:MFS transporter [Myxococcales bacterium]
MTSRASGAARASFVDLARERGFVLYQAARVLSMLGVQMQGVALAWHLYDMTRDPMSLAFVGLAQFAPQILLSLVTGLVADHVDRRRVLGAAHGLVLVAALGLFVLARSGSRRVAAIYALSVVVGAARAFGGPAGQALLPTLVPRDLFPTAVALSSSTWQLAMIVGPSVGGVVLGATGRPEAVYATTAALLAVSIGLVSLVPRPADAEPTPKRAIRAADVALGLRYVLSNKPVLGAITLDLFAVLLGGAVALLPIFAKDRLGAGPMGLGVLRAAPAIGAASMAALLAIRPLRRRAGTWLLACVFAFGVATIVFGVSTSLPLSVVALAVSGAADMVSVVVRLTLVQLKTPDEMRGRVAAVNAVFIGASNELGEFESGLTAAWLGPVAAVVVGGLGTCVVVALWAVLFPSLRKIDRLTE